jgi:hypothetical protein
MKRSLYFVAPAVKFIAGIVLTTTLPSHSVAQALGSRTEAAPCAIAISGNVNDSKVSTVCGIPPEILESLRKSIDDLIDGRLKDNQALLTRDEQTISVLNEALDLNKGQIRAALFAAGEADVPSERLAAKLVEIATRY